MLVVQLIVLKEPKKYWNTSPIINPPTANCHFNWIILKTRLQLLSKQKERKAEQSSLWQKQIVVIDIISLREVKYRYTEGEHPPLIYFYFRQCIGYKPHHKQRHYKPKRRDDRKTYFKIITEESHHKLHHHSLERPTASLIPNAV